MASSENQGLHIALIILFILVILLSVLTFMFFKQSQDMDKRFQVEQKNASDRANSERKIQEEFNDLLGLIGLPVTGDNDKDKAIAAKDEDMSRYGATLPVDKQAYRMALVELANSLKSTEASLVAAQEETARVKQLNAAFELASQKQAEEAATAKATAERELAAEKARFMDAQGRADAENRSLADKLAAVQQERNADVERMNREITQLKSRITSQDTVIASKDDRIRSFLPKPGDVADGEVRSIDQRKGTVFINVGSADFLRPGMTFGVFAPSTQLGSDNPSKASIEVTRVVSDHLAEARIVDDKLLDPIMPGDNIYTPLWNPGQAERVAIIGRIDLTGDGQDDAQMLKNIVTLNGAVVDLMISDDGQVTGELSVNTRYVIEGDVPSERARAAYERALEEAKTLGVQRVGAKAFLTHMGWHAPTQVVRFGSRGNMDRMVPPAPDGGHPVPFGNMTPGTAFERRLPPSGVPSSAYSPN